MTEIQKLYSNIYKTIRNKYPEQINPQIEILINKESLTNEEQYQLIRLVYDKSLSCLNIKNDIVRLFFDGSGDSGEVFNREYDAALNNIEDIAFIIEDHCLNMISFDWYNNEGGYGDITFDLKTGSVIIDGFERVVNLISHNEAYHV